MLVEAVILRCNHRINQYLRGLLNVQLLATLLAELGNQLAVAGVHRQRHMQLDICQRIDVRQLGFKTFVSKKTGDRNDQKADDRQTENNFENMPQQGLILAPLVFVNPVPVSTFRNRIDAHTVDCLIL